MIHEAHVKSEENRKQLEELVRDLQEREVDLESKLQSQKRSLTSDLEEQRIRLEKELNERLELESNKWVSVERERDRMKAELEEAGSLVENETSSLKFKLSSLNIELQQAKQVSNSRADKSLHIIIIHLYCEVGDYLCPTSLTPPTFTA